MLRAIVHKVIMLQIVDEPASRLPRMFDAAAVRRLSPWPDLIDALQDAFRQVIHAPLRHHHEMEVADGGRPTTLLLMPAWRPGDALGVKLVAVAPDNGARGLPSIHSVYVLSDATTGEVRAILDGGEFTARRTAAASALAIKYLARPDAKQLLIVGTGRLARNVAQAHASVRPISAIAVWGRDPDRAEAAARDIEGLTGIETAGALDLPGPTS